LFFEATLCLIIVFGAALLSSLPLTCVFGVVSLSLLQLFAVVVP
jgi:hypothetical protein